MVYNYVRAFTDYLINFTFGKGVHFRSPKETEAIVPDILKRVWEVDNNKQSLLWEIGQQGGVSGDAFIKVAYEEPYEDAIGRHHPGKVKILPLNAAFCLPVDNTEILTKRGWLKYDELTTDDLVMSYDQDSKQQVWTDVKQINVFDWDGDMHRFQNERFSALSTPDHRWVYQTKRGKEVIRTSSEISQTTAAGALRLSVADQGHFPIEEVYSDSFVELVGWAVTEGHLKSDCAGFMVSQDRNLHPDFAERIDRLANEFGGSAYDECGDHTASWYFPAAVGRAVRTALGENKGLKPEFLTALTQRQAEILYATMLDADGDAKRSRGEYFWQNNWEVMDSFQMLAMMLGKHSQAKMIQRDHGVYVKPSGTVSVYQSHHVWQKDMQQSIEHYTGKVWCPTTGTGTWVARTIENGRKQVFLTGNCFPEFHPHDRDRLIRFKLKYRFWGCVDTETEALTRSGWKRYDELSDGDEILALDPETDTMSWQPAKINVYDYDGHMVKWNGRIDAMSTPNHRWLVEKQQGRNETLRYTRQIARTEFPMDGDPSIKDLRNGSKIIVAGGDPHRVFADSPSVPDEVVETLAWFICEGNYHTNQQGYLSARVSQSATRYPEKLSRLRELASWWRGQGASFSEGAQKPSGVVEFYIGKGATERLMDLCGPGKEILPEFLLSLTLDQAELFYNTLIDADGCRTHGTKNTVRWTQLDGPRKEAFQMLAAMLGKRSNITPDGEKVQIYNKRHLLSQYVTDKAERVYLEDGKIWCPTVEGGIWFARRNGSTYWTGNTSLEGTRQVFTYTEILSDETIEEYINDELIDSRPNPLGTIPVVHIPNTRVSGSPWGLSDCHDIISLNRNYNEVSTDVADIINYHAAPVTIITGAKASTLEKGPNKVWGGLPKDAHVFNLEGGGTGLRGALEYLESVKKSMHEMIGVPEAALGQMQPISNTSGVALSIQYQPLMNKWQQKVMLYSKGLEKVNELIMLHIAIKEPHLLSWDPNDFVPPKDGQYIQLDPNDPKTYQSIAHFPEPLPLDKLVALNEIQSKMGMGLESKKGALRSLGEEFPDEKLQEIQHELIEDAKDDSAIELIRTQLAMATQMITGMGFGPDGQPVPLGGEVDPETGEPVPGADPVGPADPMTMEQVAQLGQDMVTRAYGSKMLPVQSPNKD